MLPEPVCGKAGDERADFADVVANMRKQMHDDSHLAVPSVQPSQSLLQVLDKLQAEAREIQELIASEIVKQACDTGSHEALLAEGAALVGSVITAKRDFPSDVFILKSEEKQLEFSLRCEDIITMRGLLMSKARQAVTPSSSLAVENPASTSSSSGLAGTAVVQPARDIAADIAILAPKTSNPGKPKPNKRAGPTALTKNSRRKSDTT